MRFVSAFLTAIFSTLCFAEALEIGYFSYESLSGGQNGCWYYFPVNEKHSGKVIGLGESAEDAIYLIINSKKVMVGNWQSSYEKLFHDISYSNKEYNVQIHSKVLHEGTNSGQYESTLKITTKFGEKTLEVFTECGS